MNDNHRKQKHEAMEKAEHHAKHSTVDGSPSREYKAGSKWHDIIGDNTGMPVARERELENGGIEHVVLREAKNK